MAKARPIPISFTRIISGIADYDKESILPDSVAFARQIDFRTNPRKWKILPKTIKESGSVVTGLPVWADRISTNTYVYDDAGSIYKRTSAGSTTLERTVSGSHGNGLKYFGEDGFLYYTTDTAIGRYGRIGSSPSYVDDFLTAEGGVPTNTHSLDLESSSTQYATAADSASLSITGDLAIEANFKPESLPTAGNEMVLVAKWNKNGNLRSYKLSVYAVSGYFGDASDGALTISSDTTEAPIDSACTGTSGQYTLSATNASFAAGQIVLIHQSRGTGAGTWQRNKITGYTAGTITLESALNYSYGTGAQVRVLKQYSSVTINSGKTYLTKAWNGTVGGIIAFVCSGTVTVTGTLSAAGNSVSAPSSGSSGNPAGGTGGGFRGGAADQANNDGNGTGGQGEGTAGAGGYSTAANGNGGGGGQYNGAPGGSSGAGGGNAGSGTSAGGSGYTSVGGSTAGTADLTTMVFGGGGGGGTKEPAYNAGGGGSGGGIVFVSATDLVVSGAINANGGAGATPSGDGAAGGGGGGGSILLKVQTATLGSSLITATGGAGGTSQFSGGAGGTGRIHLDYLTSYTGTTSPTLDVAQDNSLVINTTYQLRLALSSNGTNEEFLSKNLTSIAISTWGHYAVSWDASTSTATLMENGVSLGTVTGSFTSLNDNAAVLCIGASLNSSGNAESLADGKIDDVRIWGSERTAAQVLANKEVELVGTESGLKAYYQLDNSTSDTTANANNLTLQNTPVYSTDVPFSAPTTRQDIDQQDTSTGSTYTLQTAIDEGASHRQSFVPAKDPQKSIGVYFDTIGAGDVTLTIHDALNRVIATKTYTSAQLNTGHFEFVLTDVWRPVIGATYHWHLTVASGTTKIVSGTLNNGETAEFKSYYQFLVEDIFHPIEQTGNKISIGNERYVATYDASSYNPHRLVFPSGWRVRAIAKWREYYAYGCMRGDSISDYDQGIIFFWDGYSTTYNFFIEVPEGAINAMFGSQGTLYIVAGYQGDLLEYTGGDKAVKVKRIPKMTDDKYIEILPGAMTMWRTLLHIGAGVTDSSEIEQGVYSWGKRNNSYIDALSYDYKISTGTIQSTGVKIGLVMPVNKKLLIGWKDNTSYGLDYVDPANAPYAEGSIEWLIRDEDALWKEKRPDVIRADFDPLASGESVSLQYKLDRNSNWSVAEVEDTVDEKKLRLQPTFSQHREYQIRLNLLTSGSTSPEALGVTVMEDAENDNEFV